MMGRVGAGLLTVIVSLFLWGVTPVHADSLRIAPLEYRSQLGVGEKQRGFVDITNPGAQTEIVSISVQAFRQMDNRGTLQFYDSSAISQGLLPELRQFELGPRETIRLFFVADGAKLPSGDVFAALFATLQPSPGQVGVSHAVRVGTLLSLVNGTPGSRRAEITHMSLGFFQFSTKITGEYTIKNTADPLKTTGFYPDVSITVNPFTTKQISHATLLYAGHERSNPFELEVDRLGFYLVSADYQGSTKSQLVFIATGVWRSVFIGFLILVVSGAFLWYRRRTRVGARRTLKQRRKIRRS